MVCFTLELRQRMFHLNSGCILYILLMMFYITGMWPNYQLVCLVSYLVFRGLGCPMNTFLKKLPVCPIFLYSVVYFLYFPYILKTIASIKQSSDAFGLFESTRLSTSVQTISAVGAFLPHSNADKRIVIVINQVYYFVTCIILILYSFHVIVLYFFDILVS